MYWSERSVSLISQKTQKSSLLCSESRMLIIQKKPESIIFVRRVSIFFIYFYIFLNFVFDHHGVHRIAKDPQRPNRSARSDSAVIRLLSVGELLLVRQRWPAEECIDFR